MKFLQGLQGTDRLTVRSEEVSDKVLIQATAAAQGAHSQLCRLER